MQQGTTKKTYVYSDIPRRASRNTQPIEQAEEIEQSPQARQGGCSLRVAGYTIVGLVGAWLVYVLAVWSITVIMRVPTTTIFVGSVVLVSSVFLVVSFHINHLSARVKQLETR